MRGVTDPGVPVTRHVLDIRCRGSHPFRQDERLAVIAREERVRGLIHEPLGGRVHLEPGTQRERTLGELHTVRRQVFLHPARGFARVSPSFVCPPAGKDRARGAQAHGWVGNVHGRRLGRSAGLSTVEVHSL